MASVVTAAPTDGAPLLALHKLDKHFGATHALKVVISKGLRAESVQVVLRAWSSPGSYPQASK